MKRERAMDALTPFRHLHTGNETYDAALRAYRGPLTLEGVRSFLARAEAEGKSASTIAVTKAAFKKAIFARVRDVRERAAILEAFKGLKTPKADHKVHTEEVPTPAQVERVKATASPRVSAIIDFLAKTGLRVSEALGIRLADMETKGGFVYVKIRGKGKKDRRIFYPVADMAHIRETFGSREYLFERATGGRISRVYVHRAIQDAGAQAGLEGLHPHALRHYFATLQITERKKDAKAVSEWLGHAQVGTTLAMYVHSELKPEDLFGEVRSA